MTVNVLVRSQLDLLPTSAVPMNQATINKLYHNANVRTRGQPPYVFQDVTEEEMQGLRDEFGDIFV